MNPFTWPRCSGFVLFAALLLMSCAGQRAPEGGPVDAEPPLVISTDPPNYTIRFHGNSLTLEFSEYVDHRSVEGAIFISPSLGPLEFDWSGREVEIRFSEKLRRSTTYVVTVGTDAADIRARNKMAYSYTLAFSTGEDIDHGAISGRVFPRKDNDSPMGVMIFAYKLNDVRPDTLDPRSARSDYVTQTGKNGEFFLQHLSFGTYRLLAVRDEYKNLLYDPETDEFGVPSGDIALTLEDTLRSDVWMRLAKEDTTALRLLKITPVNHRHIIAEFSSQIDTSNVQADWFHIADTLSQFPLSVKSVYPVYPKLTTVTVVTDTQSFQTNYRLLVDSLRSAGGLMMSPIANALTFSASDVKDTLGPSILSSSVPDTSKEVDLEPVVLIQFSDAVQRGSVEKALVLIDSSRKHIPVSLRWLSDASLEVKPDGKLLSNAWHVLQIRMRNVLDLSGRHGRDSLRVFRFRTIDDEAFSSIEGLVDDTNRVDTAGDIFVTARNVSGKVPKEYLLKLGQSGSFAVRDILEGKYLLSAYRDRNSNGAYDPGRPFPYRPSERFTQFSDTLRLRARWPLEGVELKLR